MVLGDDGNLYLSYFTGETNEIYILKYNETTDSYESSLMGNIGNAVWPCSLLAVSDNHAEDGDADNNSLPGTELNVSSSIEAQSQTIEALTPASVTGSLNTANDAGTGAVKPADAETTTPFPPSLSPRMKRPLPSPWFPRTTISPPTASSPWTMTPAS